MSSFLPGRSGDPEYFSQSYECTKCSTKFKVKRSNTIREFQPVKSGLSRDGYRKSGRFVYEYALCPKTYCRQKILVNTSIEGHEVTCKCIVM